MPQFLLSACFVVSPLTLLMPQFLFSVHSIHCVPSTDINASVFVISMFRCVTSNVINASVFVFCTQCPRANGTPLKLKVNMTLVHGDSVLSCLLACVFLSSLLFVRVACVNRYGRVDLVRIFSTINCEYRPKLLCDLNELSDEPELPAEPQWLTSRSHSIRWRTGQTTVNRSEVTL